MEEKNIVNKNDNSKMIKNELSTKHLKKNPRIGNIDLSELRFFSYEKQRAHN